MDTQLGGPEFSPQFEDPNVFFSKSFSELQTLFFSASDSIINRTRDSDNQPFNESISYSASPESLSEAQTQASLTHPTTSVGGDSTKLKRWTPLTGTFLIIGHASRVQTLPREIINLDEPESYDVKNVGRPSKRYLTSVS